VERKRIAANIGERLDGAKLGLAGILRHRRHWRAGSYKQDGNGDEDARDAHALSDSTKTGATVLRFASSVIPRFHSS
jgi:hypothetical protein